MANKRIEMLVLKQIIQLKNKGVSNRKIANQLGIHRNSINSYVSSFLKMNIPIEELLNYSELELEKLFDNDGTYDKRYAELNALYPYYERELKKVGCTYQTLWYGYKEQYPQGYGYTRFKHYLQQWGLKQQVSMPMSHKMGDKLFIDFTGKKLHYIDKSTGEQIELEVFVATLGGSQYTYVEAVESQGKEDFIKALTNSLSWIGGVPQAIVCDNLKAAVDKSSKYEAKINKNLRSLGLHYNTTILPTRAYKPQDKSLVEGAVKLVYQRIFYKLNQCNYFSLKGINKAIKEILTVYNDHLFQGRDYSRKDLFCEEKEHLMPLPATHYQIKYYKRAKVQKNSHVWLGDDAHYYSVPYQYISKHTELQYTKTVIEIYYNHERIATHPRNKIAGEYSTNNDHMPSTHQFVGSWNPDFFIRWASRQNEDISSYVQKLFKKKAYPEHNYKICVGLQQLCKQYGKDRLAKACIRATEYEKFGYMVVKNILQRGIDKLTDEGIPEVNIDQNHQNIRGGDYYQ